MGSSGLINWHRLDNTLPWVRWRQGERTSVFAFWLVDYGSASKDHGVALLKAEDRHPDWFLHAETADHVLAAYPPPKAAVSPNHHAVFEGFQSRPLIGSLLLGSIDACYRRMERMWWASEDDLTWRGKRLLKKLNQLYEREAILVTFVENPADDSGSPRGSV